MSLAPWPAKETMRLAKLRGYSILDTLPEPAFDDIVELAAHICGTPTALVSLIDANRQWFKAKVGLEASETPRDIAFCNYTIQQPDPLVVEDTHQSGRFRDNVLVTGPPHIRFYAGVPLITPDGHALGSLCVIDYQPRKMTPHQLRALKVLSHQIIAQMELSRQAHLLKLSNEELEQRVGDRTAGLTSALQRLLKTQSKLIKREAALRHNSLHDPLTGLPNRSYFLQRLDQAIQLSHRQPAHLYAVLFIDLDNFKPVNDTLGHGVGDLLLQHVAGQITLMLRRSDLVARLGGDEFAVLLDDIPNEDHAIFAVKRLQKQLKSPFMLGDRKVYISASIGITFSTIGYRQPEAALRDADTAMYHAKNRTKRLLAAQIESQLKQHDPQPKPAQSQSGHPATALPFGGKSPILIHSGFPLEGHQFAVFDTAMQGKAQARLTLEDELHYALRQKQFHLYYQPIFELQNQQLVGFEVLIRWHHPTRGRLDAAEFIDIAEEIGIIRQLCNQMTRTACAQLKKWRSHPSWSTLSLHINLSLLQIQSSQLVTQWQTNLDKHQLSAAAFQLEIDEQVLLSSDPSITTVLQQLKTLGFGLCVDDFGRGHSSLSRLHQLEVSTLKIDRAFIEELTTPGRSDIVKTIVDLGSSANIAVIAEGIETAAQLETLLSLGCRLGQGFWLSEPLSASTIDEMLSAFP
ncbi:MAG: sensor domain-containing phosphodiesterase [Phormidesmis sp.]